MDNSKGHVGGISISSDLGRYVLVIINVDIAVGVEDPKRCSSTLVFKITAGCYNARVSRSNFLTVVRPTF